MSRLNLPTDTGRTTRIALAVCCNVLALMTVIGTSPAPLDADEVSGVAEEAVLSSGDVDGPTFAEVFENMREPETTSFEGVGAVEVAPAAPGIPDPGAPQQAMTSAGASTPPPAAALAQVTAVRPTLIIRNLDPATSVMAGQVDGVAIAADAMVGQMSIAVPGGRQTVSVAAVNPEQFRPLTPEMTAGEGAVWDRIIAGDAAFTHDTGTRLSVPLGTTVETLPATEEQILADQADDGAGGGQDGAGAAEGGAGGAVGGAEGMAFADADNELVGPAVNAESAPGAAGAPLRVGALASNGIPPVADALISTDTAKAIGLTGQSDLYIALDEGADQAAVQAALAQVTGGDVEELTLPESQTNTFGAFLVGAQAQNFFEPFDYLDHGDGLITIDSGWTSRNIASTNMIPMLNGTVRCHRQMLIQLYAAMSEVQAAGLGGSIDPSQYGGCWVARHIDFNPSKPISMHGWGLAVDLNVSTNQLGASPTLDPRIVEIFDRWGFVWGGRWSRPDGMHFEIGAVIDVPVPPGFFN